MRGAAPSGGGFRRQNLEDGSPPLLSLVLNAAQRTSPNGSYRNQHSHRSKGPVEAYSHRPHARRSGEPKECQHDVSGKSLHGRVGRPLALSTGPV